MKIRFKFPSVFTTTTRSFRASYSLANNTSSIFLALFWKVRNNIDLQSFKCVSICPLASAELRDQPYKALAGVDFVHKVGPELKLGTVQCFAC